MARKQEIVTAERHGGRGTPASGSGELVKNDVRNDEWSIEVKTTTHKTYSLALSVWEQAEKHALVDGRRAAMVICYDKGLGKPPKRLVILDENDYLELVENGTAS